MTIAGGLYVRIPERSNQAKDAGASFTHQVLDLLRVLFQTARIRHFLGILLLLNLFSGHMDFQSQRYDALGMTPERFAVWNMGAVPVSFCTTYFFGTTALPAHRLRSLYAGLLILNLISLWHLRACQKAEPKILETGSLYWAYAGLQLLRKLITDSIFVIEVSMINNFSSEHPAMAGSVISILASASNFFGSLPEQWMPLSIESFGLDSGLFWKLAGFYYESPRPAEVLPYAGFQINQGVDCRSAQRPGMCSCAAFSSLPRLKFVTISVLQLGDATKRNAELQKILDPATFSAEL